MSLLSLIKGSIQIRCIRHDFFLGGGIKRGELLHKKWMLSFTLGLSRKLKSLCYASVEGAYGVVWNGI